MSAIKIAIWIFLFILMIALLGTVFYVIQKVRSFSKSVFGTENLVEGVQKQADRVACIPKSVNSMTRLMEPQIVRDFPDFVWEQFKEKAENMLCSAMLAITKQDIHLLQEADEELTHQVSNRIKEAKLQMVQECFSDIHIHQTEISNYRKTGGTCVITIQSSIEYYYMKYQKESLLEGSKDRKVQTKYNMELIYIQDATKAGADSSRVAHCPNCGAPVTVLGHKYCEYCGTAITLIQSRVWSFHSFREN